MFTRVGAKAWQNMALGWKTGEQLLKVGGFTWLLKPLSVILAKLVAEGAGETYEFDGAYCVYT